MSLYGNESFTGVSKPSIEAKRLVLNRVKSDLIQTDQIKIGSSGTALSNVSTGTLSVNPAGIVANSRGSVSVTLTGCATTDRVTLQPPASLNDDLLYVGCRVTAANTLTIYLYNATDGTVDDGALNWDYLWVKTA
jgi:hypothetical protein